MAVNINGSEKCNLTRFGKNGHVEYGWSNNIQEKILQFSFQITRTDRDGVFRLSIILNELLSCLKHNIDTGSLIEKKISKEHLSILYKMIGHTRDIVDGKGEYTLSYMMVHTWNKFYPSLAKFALRCFVTLDKKEIHQYGSWKDLKYFCEYCKNQGDNIDNTLIEFAISLINEQIKKDYASFLSKSNDISLAAKWSPREKSSFGWLYKALATNYFGEFLTTANNNERQKKAILKCKTEYRKILSTLNRLIDTTQIKQCARTWKHIDFNKVTSVTLSKQKKAFLNIKNNGEVRYPDNFDRKACSDNLSMYIQNVVKCETDIKGARIGMGDFTKQAISLLKNGTQIEKNILNSQWRDNSTHNSAVGNMIAMVDVSGSMDGEPMEVAIALGIRIAEKSLIGKRIMTFSAKPSWVNLEPYSDFITQVDVIKNAEWGMNTNFYAAFDLILNAIIQNKMSSEDVENMILVILSDMQIDSCDSCDKQVLYDTMKIKYREAGIRANGVPYKPPHIVFWNLKSTYGFPSLANQSNTSMISGYSPIFLNSFCEQGLCALQKYTPWSLLVKSLDNQRYNIMQEKFYQEI